jgi:hypothetical protein
MAVGILSTDSRAWFLTLRSLVKKYQRLGVTYCLHLKCRKKSIISWLQEAFYLLLHHGGGSSLRSSETSICFYYTARRHVPGDNAFPIFVFPSHVNLQSYSKWFLCKMMSHECFLDPLKWTQEIRREGIHCRHLTENRDRWWGCCEHSNEPSCCINFLTSWVTISF